MLLNGCSSMSRTICRNTLKLNKSPFQNGNQTRFNHSLSQLLIQSSPNPTNHAGPFQAHQMKLWNSRPACLLSCFSAHFLSSLSSFSTSAKILSGFNNGNGNGNNGVDPEVLKSLKLGSSVYRSQKCGDIDESWVSKEIVLSGWLSAKRDKKEIVFLRIMDISGSIQVVLNKTDPNFATLRQLINDTPMQSVILVKGTVIKKPPQTIKGESIEIAASSIEVLNEASLAPFSLDQKSIVHEETRQEFRFLDIRRPAMQVNLLTRSLVSQIVRLKLWEMQFIEIETPTLFKRTPEGAREFLVPTRNEGYFYALPQSPQQYKQMIMVGGYDRYFQFARCYRDEDLRADRQPEFTQIDLEMSFVTPIDIQNVIEHLITSIWSSVKGINIPTPFPRMSYQVAMEKYGVDKPDTRFGMEIQDLQNVFKDSTYISSNHPAVCGFSFNIPKELKSKFLAKYEKMYSGNESFKLFQVSSQESSGGKKLVPEIPLEYFINSNVSVQADDFVFVATGVSKNKLLPILGKVRLQFATFLEELDYPIRDLNRFDFLWVEDFPLFSESETQEGVLEATHHPFTAPHPDDLPILFTDPKRVRGLHYDVVVNGWELGGGSIRVHNSEFQEKIIKDILKSDSTKFSHLLKALKTGAPPHGGIALGFDRLMAILLGTKSIREVIAFPKSFSGKDLTCDSPSKVSNSELREYGLEMSLKK